MKLNLNIRGRLILGFTAVALVLAGAVATTLWKVTSVKHEVDRITELRLPTAFASTGMINGINGDYAAVMANWEVVTEQIALANNVSEVVGAVASTATEMQTAAESVASTAAETSRQSRAAAGTQEVSENVTNVNPAASETGTVASQALQSGGELAKQAEIDRAVVDAFLSGVKAA